MTTHTIATLAAAGALALAGCQTVDRAVGAASAEINRLCRIEPAAHLAFVALAAGRVPAKARAAEAQAHAAAAAICARRPIADGAGALTALAGAYAAVLAARADLEEEK
ncbi:hypothetical protein NPA31_007085 [Aurantimonas sp. MSK8Z-1]|uniref:hypothetical protein n=1 Tax=Mangrovibrevibacter kandeliae TaxID=2968473 RepID=UPI0021198358|nr:hypothetical protein [Aurantimonas sp. MSK8Z-1]MCW4114725.1 hypothetical protein [Aurantimonas sp. MSK8Z-1]